MLLATIRRDLRLHARHPAEIVNPLAFFVIVVSLFPLGVSPAPETLRGIAPGVIWVAALLASMLSMDLLFRGDHDDGSLDHMVASEQPLFVIVTGKIIVHWLLTGLPLTLMSPVLGLMMALPDSGLLAVVLSLLLGTPILSLLGAIGASLTTGLRRGGLLVAILVLPLAIPVLIIATELIKTGAAGGDITGHCLWLAALLALAFGLAPIAASAGVRISVSQ